MKNENEINDETKSALEISLCALLLESSRRYSVLADAVFGFSVEQSNFANKIAGQRMTLAKVVVQKKTDFVIALEGEALEIYQCHVQMDVTQEIWEDCLSLDEIIQEILEDDGDRLEASCSRASKYSPEGRRICERNYRRKRRGRSMAMPELRCNKINNWTTRTLLDM